MVALLTDRGIAPEAAASGMAVAGVAMMLGRVVVGFLVDRFFAPYVALIFFLVPLTGLCVLYFLMI